MIVIYRKVAEQAIGLDTEKTIPLSKFNVIVQLGAKIYSAFQL